jgi:DinB superfamily
MKFSVEKSIEILERTPFTLFEMLNGLSPEWTSVNEGGETWAVYDVIGHLIHGDEVDWMARTKIIFNNNGDKKLQSFDRFAQFKSSKGKSLAQLLEEFKDIRNVNIAKLKNLNIIEKDFEKTGTHPVLGTVKLSQLLSTWVAHDLDHIHQIARIMAKQYQQEVGPWIVYLKILR